VTFISFVMVSGSALYVSPRSVANRLATRKRICILCFIARCPEFLRFCARKCSCIPLQALGGFPDASL